LEAPASRLETKRSQIMGTCCSSPTMSVWRFAIAWNNSTRLNLLAAETYLDISGGGVSAVVGEAPKIYPHEIFPSPEYLRACGIARMMKYHQSCPTSNLLQRGAGVRSRAASFPRYPFQSTTVRRATRGIRTVSLTGKITEAWGILKVSMCPRIPSAFMTFCLAREDANRVKGHTQRPFPTKERPPEMLILTPEHGEQKSADI
jgi:hypothetical protein